MKDIPLNMYCSGCGFVFGRHSIDGNCPKSRIQSPMTGGRVEGMRYILKGHFMKKRRFKKSEVML